MSVANGKMFRKLGRPDFTPAIAELKISLDTMRTNEPINRREGHAAQADLEKENAASYKAAIKFLGKGR